jgi:carbonic anhydrase
LLFQLNSQNSTEPIDTVISYIDQISNPGEHTEIPNLNLSSLADSIYMMRFFNYKGSLTTPPCLEGVTFLVASDQLPLSVETYNSLKAVVGFNSRFLQTAIPAEENILCTSAKGLKCDGKKGAPHDLESSYLDIYGPSALRFQQTVT